MWLFTPRGFYSAVEKTADRADGMLTVRARNKGDLDRLKDLLPNAKPFKESYFTDYEWRIRVPREDWADAVQKMSLEIDYNNFKDRVKKDQGDHRASVYSRVWGDLLALESQGRKGSWTTTTKGKGKAKVQREYKLNARVWNGYLRQAGTVKGFSELSDAYWIVYDGQSKETLVWPSALEPYRPKGSTPAKVSSSNTRAKKGSGSRKRSGSKRSRAKRVSSEKPDAGPPPAAGEDRFEEDLLAKVRDDLACTWCEFPVPRSEDEPETCECGGVLEPVSGEGWTTDHAYTDPMAPGRLDVDGHEWWACDPYPTWYRYDEDTGELLDEPAEWAEGAELIDA